MSKKRPEWCPHADCIFKRSANERMCGGELLVALPHDPGGYPVNDLRICLDTRETHSEILELECNDSDLDWWRWIFDALDGKKTSWISRIGEHDG